MTTPTSNGQSAADAVRIRGPVAAATPEDLRLALRAATLYYLDGMTQAEVATRLGVSRPTAGRLIARAKAKGLVRIEVVVPPDAAGRAARRRGARARAALRPHRGGRGRPRRRRRHASDGPPLRQRRPRRCRAADAPALRRRHPRIHLGPRAGRGRDGAGARRGEVPRRRPARRRDVDGHATRPEWSYILGRSARRAARQRDPAARAALRGPVDGGVHAKRLRHLPHARGGPPRRH